MARQRIAHWRHVTVFAILGATLGGGIGLALYNEGVPPAIYAPRTTQASQTPPKKSDITSNLAPADGEPSTTGGYVAGTGVDPASGSVPSQSSSSTGSVSPTAPQQLPPPATPMPPKTVRAALTINGASRGDVTVPDGSSHCDVLSQALKDGLIESLDMRYYAQYQSYGVYVIDGIGDSESVWWTYKVNSKPLPYGCSRAPVSDGDRAEWIYLR